MQLKEKKIFTVPNQKVIEISPGNGREEGETYGIITRREEMTAAKLLNDRSVSLMLYYHFALNQDGYEFALSPTEIQEKLGITLKQYYKSIENLKRAGYLVQSKAEGNRWMFLRIPEQVKDSGSIGKDEKEGFSPGGREQSCGKTQQNAGVYQKVETCTPPKVETCVSLKVETRVPSEEERNNTNNNTDNNISNIIDALTIEISPTEKKEEDQRKQEEKNRLIEVFKREFGHYDDYGMQLHEIELRSRKDVDKFIKLIKKKMDELRRRSPEKLFRLEYDCELRKTYPKNPMELIKVNMILERYFQNNPMSRKYGAWVNGWNEGIGQPNIFVATEYLSLDDLKKQKHDLSGIPKWYLDECKRFYRSPEESSKRK